MGMGRDCFCVALSKKSCIVLFQNKKRQDEELLQRKKSDDTSTAEAYRNFFSRTCRQRNKMKESAWNFREGTSFHWTVVFMK